jgi:hypothetical protein
MLSLEGMYGRWPAWAVNPFACCVLLCGVVFFGQSRLVGKQTPDGKLGKGKGGRDAEFRAFQTQWLLVYLLTMLADWLQGTHMYSLYESYGQPPGTLFSIGFTSSAVFGTFLGILVDKHGRRRACIAFCVLEIIINALEHVNNWELLILGRILGGISTSLLFTAFESWMVSEHRRRGSFTLSPLRPGLTRFRSGFHKFILTQKHAPCADARWGLAPVDSPRRIFPRRSLSRRWATAFVPFSPASWRRS